MKKVVFDIDGVLADFEKAFCKEFGWNNRHLVSLEERYPDKTKEIKEFIHNPSVYANLEFLELGGKMFQFFDNKAFNISLVSARPYYLAQCTWKWVRKHGVTLRTDINLSRADKIIRIEDIKPDFIIDDLLSVVEPVSDELGIPSFLIDHPWNQKDNLAGNIHRIRDFSEFLQIYEQLYS